MMGDWGIADRVGHVGKTVPKEERDPRVPMADIF